MRPMVRGPTPINILLVEDDPSDVELTRRALQRAKLQNRVWIVGDGVEALAFLRREGPHHGVPRPDLVLLDLKLPNLDGRDVLMRIRISTSRPSRFGSFRSKRTRSGRGTPWCGPSRRRNASASTPSPTIQTRFCSLARCSARRVRSTSLGSSSTRRMLIGVGPRTMGVILRAQLVLR